MSTHRTRIDVPDIWHLIADLLDHQDIATLSHTSRFLRDTMLAHLNGYLLVQLPTRRTPSQLKAKLQDALDYADQADRRVDISVPDAISRDSALGDWMLGRIYASSSKIVGLQITLPLGLETRLRTVVQQATKLRALHIWFHCNWDEERTQDGSLLDFSDLFNPGPEALRHFSIFCLDAPIALPTNLGDLRGLRSLQLCGLGAENDWQADWKAAVSALADYVPTLNVRLEAVEPAKVDIGPLLRGLGACPLIVAFPDSCPTPGHFTVSTVDGRVSRRLQWGWGIADEGLTERICAQLAPVAAQCVSAHIDSMVLKRGDTPENLPQFRNLRHIFVHSFDDVDAQEAMVMDSDAEPALDCVRQLTEAALRFMRCGNGVQVVVWCPHCADPDAARELYDKANATPGPSA